MHVCVWDVCVCGLCGVVHVVGIVCGQCAVSCVCECVCECVCTVWCVGHVCVGCAHVCVGKVCKRVVQARGVVCAVYVVVYGVVYA